MKTVNWFKRLCFWLLIVAQEASESGTAYPSQMMIPFIFGALSLIAPFLVLGVFPEIRGVWYMAFAIGITLYLVIGVATYFSSMERTHGSWQNRGTW